MPCKFEDEMIRALRSDTWPSELLRHKESCADCREALRIAAALQADASALSARAELPPAMQIWAAVENRRRTTALDRAMVCVRILKISGFAYALLFALWAAHALGGAHGIALPHLDGTAWSASIGGLALAAVCLGTGLVFALRGERLRLH